MSSGSASDNKCTYGLSLYTITLPSSCSQRSVVGHTPQVRQSEGLGRRAMKTKQANMLIFPPTGPQPSTSVDGRRTSSPVTGGGHRGSAISRRKFPEIYMVVFPIVRQRRWAMGTMTIHYTYNCPRFGCPTPPVDQTPYLCRFYSV